MKTLYWFYAIIFAWTATMSPVYAQVFTKQADSQQSLIRKKLKRQRERFKNPNIQKGKDSRVRRSDDRFAKDGKPTQQNAYYGLSQEQAKSIAQQKRNSKAVQNPKALEAAKKTAHSLSQQKVKNLKKARQTGRTLSPKDVQSALLDVSSKNRQRSSVVSKRNPSRRQSLRNTKIRKLQYGPNFARVERATRNAKKVAISREVRESGSTFVPDAGHFQPDYHGDSEAKSVTKVKKFTRAKGGKERKTPKRILQAFGDASKSRSPMTEAQSRAAVLESGKRKNLLGRSDVSQLEDYVKRLTGLNKLFAKDVNNPFDDFYEENDFRFEAYPITEFDAVFAYQFDNDYYEIYIEPGFREIDIQIAFDASFGDIDLQLQDEFGGVIASSTSAFSDTERINVIVNQPGFYFIRVYFDNEGNDYDLVYDTYPTGGPIVADCFEDNDNINEAFSLVDYRDLLISDIPGGCIGVAGDDDWYEIYVEKGYERMVLELYFDDFFGNLDLELYNDIGARETSSRSNSNDELIDLTINDAGDRFYYVRVFPRGGIGSINAGNTYNFAWNTLRTGLPLFFEDSFEPNNSIAVTRNNARANLSDNENQWISEVLPPGGTQIDDDHFEIWVPENYLNVVVDLRFFHDQGDLGVELYHTNGSLLARADSQSDNELLEVTVAEPGQYFIKVYGDNGGNAYDLLWFADFSGFGEDAFEPNNTLADAVFLPNEDEFIQASQFDTDYYAIQVFENFQRVVVDLRYPSSGGNVAVELIQLNDQGQEEVVAFSDTAGDDEFIDAVVNSDGLAYIKVTGDNSNIYDLAFYTVRNDFFNMMQIGQSGLWFEPRSEGQGFSFQLVQRPDAPNEVIMAWFTFDPTVTSGQSQQFWYTGAGRVYGNVVELDLYETIGGLFDEPSTVENILVGTATLTFLSGQDQDGFELNPCYDADFEYAFTDRAGNFQNDVIPLLKLSPALYDAQGFDLCTDEQDENLAAQVSLQGIQVGHQSAWFDPATAGQGMYIDYIFVPDAEDQLFTAWYTYDPADPDFEGNGGEFADQIQFWMVSTNAFITEDPNGDPAFVNNDSFVLFDWKIPNSGYFDQPTPNGYELLSWGTGFHNFQSCDLETFDYISTFINPETGQEESFYVDDQGNDVVFENIFDQVRLTPVWENEAGLTCLSENVFPLASKSRLQKSKTRESQDPGKKVYRRGSNFKPLGMN